MISRIKSKKHTDMVNLRPITLIRIEEDEVSDAELREIFDLNFCIRNNHDPRGGVTYFEGAAGYRAMGLLWFQTERNRGQENYCLASGGGNPKPSA